MTNFVTLTRMRIQLTLRNKMFLFFSVVMPFGFFFLYAGVFARGIPRAVLYFLGPVLALTVMGSFWGLSALVTFREQGILRRFHVTPVTPSDMLASSVVANFVLTLPTVFIEFLFARAFFHVTHLGNLVSAFLLIAVGAVSFASMGLVVASVTNTMQETQVINQLIWFPLIFLSGATVPLADLPQVVKHVGLFLPATYLPPSSSAGSPSQKFPAEPSFSPRPLLSLSSFWGFGNTKPTGPWRRRKLCLIRSIHLQNPTLLPDQRPDLQFQFFIPLQLSTYRLETAGAKLVGETAFPSRLMH